MNVNQIYLINVYFLFIAFVVNFILGFIVYLRNKRSITNITFALVAFDLGLWALSTFLIYTFPYLFWMNYVIVFFGFSILTTFLLFAKNFPTPPKFFPALSYFFLIIWQIFITIGCFIPNWFFSKIWIENGMPRVEFGLGYNITSILIAFPVIYFFYLLYTKYKKATGIGKMQMKYLFSGLITFGLMAIFLSLVLVGLNIIYMADFSPSFSLVMVGFIAYAIIKHRLMDIRLIIVKSLLYSFLIAAIASLYLLVIFFLKDPLASKFQISPNVTFILTGLLLVLGFSPIKKLVEKATDRWLYKGRYNPSLVLDKIGEITNSILFLEPLLKSLLQTLTFQMKVSKMAILLDNQSQTLSYKVSSKFSFRSLLKLLGKNNILVTDELEEESPVKKTLRKLNISLLVPLLMEQKPIGLLVLGDKKSGDAYTNEDINFLAILAHAISIAVKNAQLYSKIVSDKERIKKLLTAKEGLEKTEEKLISEASSKIEIPLTRTAEYISKAAEEKEKLTPKARYFLERTRQVSSRSIVLISKMIEASELENKEITLHPEPMDLQELITKVISQFSFQAKQKNLDLVYIKEKKLPYVLADPKYLEKVLIYLLENSLKFIKKGKITITGEAKGDKVIVSIKDTGIGIPKKHQPLIFEKFYQVDTSYTREYQGTGLGLYIVKLLLALHKEKISVYSMPGKGSEFIFSLPLAK